MKTLKLDSKGDLVIENGDFVYIHDKEAVQQAVRTVLGSNNGEWGFNENYGINFYYILAKNPNEDIIRNEISKGLKQVDNTFVITQFSLQKVDNAIDSRQWVISFEAVNADGLLLKEGSALYAQ